MSEKKISQIFNFPLPVYAKQLKSFLGLANYFRPHVRNHATIAHPLHGMLSNYNRAKVLKWTPELEASFRELQRLISECPTMYFVDPDIPTRLLTVWVVTYFKLSKRLNDRSLLLVALFLNLN